MIHSDPLLFLAQLLNIDRLWAVFAIALLAAWASPLVAAVAISIVHGATWERPWSATAWYYGSTALVLGASIFIGAVGLLVMLALACAGPLVAWHLYRERELGPGKCERCGYDLTGNVTGVCPECGAEVRERE